MLSNLKFPVECNQHIHLGSGENINFPSIDILTFWIVIYGSGNQKLKKEIQLVKI